MNEHHKKALALGFPNAKLVAHISFNEENCALSKALGRAIEAAYPIKDIVENGVLIGNLGHLQLIEWKFVKEIY